MNREQKTAVEAESKAHLAMAIEEVNRQQAIEAFLKEKAKNELEAAAFAEKEEAKRYERFIEAEYAQDAEKARAQQEASTKFVLTPEIMEAIAAAVAKMGNAPVSPSAALAVSHAALNAYQADKAVQEKMTSEEAVDAGQKLLNIAVKGFNKPTTRTTDKKKDVPPAKQLRKASEKTQIKTIIKENSSMDDNALDQMADSIQTNASNAMDHVKTLVLSNNDDQGPAKDIQNDLAYSNMQCLLNSSPTFEEEFEFALTVMAFEQSLKTLASKASKSSNKSAMFAESFNELAKNGVKAFVASRVDCPSVQAGFVGMPLPLISGIKIGFLKSHS